jgi:hypothetical protein
MGQKTRFAQMVDRMYFNVFARNPDTAIRPFIKKYFPAFTTWKDENGGWAYNYKEKDLPMLDTTMHSFSFTKHPLVKSTFSTGRFDFITYEKKDNLPLIAEWLLSFSFNNANDALNCFDSICNLFGTVSNGKARFIKNQRTIAQFSNESNVSDTNCIELILVSDDLYDNRYKIYFHTGRFFSNN